MQTILLSSGKLKSSKKQWIEITKIVIQYLPQLCSDVDFSVDNFFWQGNQSLATDCIWNQQSCFDWLAKTKMLSDRHSMIRMLFLEATSDVMH